MMDRDEIHRQLRELVNRLQGADHDKEEIDHDEVAQELEELACHLLVDERVALRLAVNRLKPMLDALGVGGGPALYGLDDIATALRGTAQMLRTRQRLHKRPAAA